MLRHPLDARALSPFAPTRHPQTGLWVYAISLCGVFHPRRYRRCPAPGFYHGVITALTTGKMPLRQGSSRAAPPLGATPAAFPAPITGIYHVSITTSSQALITSFYHGGNARQILPTTSLGAAPVAPGVAPALPSLRLGQPPPHFRPQLRAFITALTAENPDFSPRTPPLRIYPRPNVIKAVIKASNCP